MLYNNNSTKAMWVLSMEDKNKPKSFRSILTDASDSAAEVADTDALDKPDMDVDTTPTSPASAFDHSADLPAGTTKSEEEGMGPCIDYVITVNCKVFLAF